MSSPSQVDLGWLNSDTFLWSYFVHRTTKIFLCWDPDKVSSGEISDDPFAKVLVSLAVSSTPVRLAALGLAAFMYHEDFGDTRFQLQASRFKHQALQASCNAQLSPVIHARSLLETVITMLLLILFSQDGRPSMLDIAKGAAIRMLDSDTRCYIDDMYLEVAMHLLRWCEICAQCSLRDTAQPTDQRSHPIIEFDNQELETRLSRHFGTWVVHPLYSFSHRWINPLLRLGRLVRLRRSRRNTDEPFDTEALTKQVDDLEEDLLTAREADLIAFQIGSGEYPDLLYLNEAMHSAIVILFYSRLRDLSWTSPLIRKHVRNVYEQLAQINQYSRTLNNAIFPLYAAGCEAVDMAARQEIEARITHIHPTGYWFNRETKLVSGLRHVWTVRDNDPGHGWMEWSEQGKRKSGDINASIADLKNSTV
ncbi:fungal-specific transcription factor domain-containing protein [Diaporthe sp. PMI_573]|nr:fungal-specific transcription factor domain-containing protein [Diaporthaceae sp. PMI_573]